MGISENIAIIAGFTKELVSTKYAGNFHTSLTYAVKKYPILKTRTVFYRIFYQRVRRK